MKSKVRSIVLFAVVMFSSVCGTRVAGAGAPEPSPAGIGKEQARLVRAAMVGSWVTQIGGRNVTLRLSDDGRFLYEGLEGSFAAQGNQLWLKLPAGEIGYQFDLTGDVLTLSGADLIQPLKLSRSSRRTSLRAMS